MSAFTYRLRDVRVAYATRTALEIAALDVRCGQITAVVGPNGAGKSTLLRTLAFLLAPMSGQIEFLGRTVTYREAELADLRRQVTCVAQAPLLFHRSVRGNVAYGVRARGLPADGRVDAALDAVGLSGFAERPAWKLSGGEAQRVAIARALAIDPAVYLFDEPTASIDRASILLIESLLAQLSRAGKTVVVSTHNVEQAYRVSETVVALEAGHVTPTPLVNLLRGETVRIGEQFYFESSGLRIEMPDATPHQVIALDAEDIIVSRAPLQSSARNCFAGRISRVARDERGIVLTVDCGRPLIARITAHSYEAMALNLGTPVYVTFKSTAVHSNEQ